MSNIPSAENDKNLFEKLGLEVVHDEVQIGKTYPIFGAITSIGSYDESGLEIKINYNITARLNVSSAEKIETLRQKAFESGIFISTVVAKEPHVVVECQTVIFGRNQAGHC